ncbi:crotonobetainyl-CoA:carnitine CoA-transferase CaiB-like acyl-CoA transferase [Nonomuraea thailandensis]|uniref:Crotonobetainyl-CoA:carnitine CoA-transferase CaiB-like acyl-CoA transferase n=1 Tax=Nonomuraea thailandensis TaxID=1188745 RepID=A0A9X2GGH1_9ACTN|nr:CoA transferase [Nonomuraea thailandensis]MCP2357375.1 crotonobetainyl-CoA:carnitine CoA-transferase CaiB-like acyl-CoA transferase [Nonomuraea thailandensis]
MLIEVSLVEERFAEHDTATLLGLLAEAGVPAGKVRDVREVYEWDQTRSQGPLLDV